MNDICDQTCRNYPAGQHAKHCERYDMTTAHRHHQAGAEEMSRLAEANKPLLRLNAYYYGFDKTNVDTIDRLLAAVACAGKSAHNTAEWYDKTHPIDSYLEGETPVDWIQNAANNSAAEITRLTEANKRLVAEKKRLWGEITRLCEADERLVAVLKNVRKDIATQAGQVLWRDDITTTFDYIGYEIGDAVTWDDYMANLSTAHPESTDTANGDEGEVCSDCPPSDYVTDETRCSECPRLGNPQPTEKE